MGSSDFYLKNWMFPVFHLLAILAISASSSEVTKPVIEHVSSDTYELEATSVRLDCQASGGPQTKINWFHAETGKPVEDYQAKPATSNKMIMPNAGGRGSILILGLHRRDEGQYYCNASNKAGWVVSRNITVQLAFLRKNFVHPQSKRAKVGETVQMECIPPRGLPKPKVEWKKDGKLIKENEPRAPGDRPHFMVLTSGNLRIYNARISDSGRYQCVARNKAGKRESNVAVLQVREKPTFIRPPTDERVNINDDVIFHCGVKGDPPPTIIWKRVDGEMPARNEILSDNSLKLYRVQLSASGRYVCQASNKVGRIEAVAQLIVQSPPSFTRTPIDKKAAVGSKVVFHCEVAGRPRPAVYWEFGKAPLMFTEHVTRKKSRIQVHRDGRLVINSVRKSDEGRYVCHATSYEKHIRSTAMLTVLDGNSPYPPIIKYGPKSQVLPSGRNALLRCIVDANKSHRIKVQWFRNGAALPLDFSNPRYVRSNDGSLQIADITPDDSGNFTCVASAGGLSTNLTAQLRVLRKSYSNDEERQVVSAPDITLLPKKPIRVRVMEIQDTWVHLAWEPNPDVGASQSQSYQVEAFTIQDRHGWVIKDASVRQDNYRVKNLKPDSEYWFLIRARNIYGLGAPSDLTKAVHTKTKSQMPRDLFHVSRLIGNVRIQNVRIDSISINAVRVRWEVRGPSHSLLAVRGFELRYKEVPITRCLISGEYSGYCSLTGQNRRQLERSLRNGDRAVYLAGLKDTKMHTKRYEEQVSAESRFVSYIIYGLKPFHCYEVEIEPYSVGEFVGRIAGRDSKKKTILTYDSQPSKSPNRISARWFVNNSVEISWRPPPVAFRNGVLTGYSIHIVGNESRFNKYRTTNASVHKIVVDDMLPEVAYTIHLAAKSCKGTGIRSIALRLGPAAQRASGHSVITQAWFIGTMVGVGIVWILLCLFTVYICRHRYHRNLLYKPVYFNGSLEERTQMGGGYNMRSLVGKHDPDSMPAPPPPPPPLSLVGTNEKAMSASTDASMKNGAYATPSSVLPPVAPVQNPVAPYATASIIQNMINLQPPNSGPYCGASSDNSVSESKVDSSAMASGVGGGNTSSYGHYSEGGPPGCNTCSEYSESQGEEIGAWPASIAGGRQKIKNIGEIIPPPPEYPPPPAPASGSVPMSPKPALSVTMGTSMMNGPPVSLSVRLPTAASDPTGCGHVDVKDETMGRPDDKDTLLERGCPPAVPVFPPPPSSSVPPPTSPLATEEGVYTGIDSESEVDHSEDEELGDGSAPALGRRSPGMQSSLVGEPGESVAGSSVLASWASGLTGEGPGEVGGVPVDDEDDISSVDSSCSDTNMPFLPETDFASAVQMAANAAAAATSSASGSGGRRGSGTGTAGAPGMSSGRRRRHVPRTPSPGYSTDSNYAALPPQPHRPYPKSERKRQMKQYAGNPKLMPGAGVAQAPLGRYLYGPPHGLSVMYPAGMMATGCDEGKRDAGKTLGTFTDSPIV